jgi:hypothetical protein
MDFAVGLASYLGDNGKVFCAAFSPSAEDIANAGNKHVSLLKIDRPIGSPAYDKSWAWDVWQRFKEGYPDQRVDWWVGHDVTTGWAAVEGPVVAAHGQSALIMHMNYVDYQAYKGRVGQDAYQKVSDQRRLFPKAARWFANGPLVRNALSGIVHSTVTMLVPGFANVHPQPSQDRLKLITFGRMDRESGRGARDGDIVEAQIERSEAGQRGGDGRGARVADIDIVAPQIERGEAGQRGGDGRGALGADVVTP